jgi:hypothetical protein
MVIAALLLTHIGCTRTNLTRADDLDWLADKLPLVHPDPFRSMSEAEYRQKIAELRTVAEGLTLAEYYVSLARIVASLGDDHTLLELSASAQESFGTYPMGLWWFPDGLYVVRADESISWVVGQRVVGIEGMPTEEAMNGVAPLIPKAGEGLAVFRTPVLLVRPEVLYGLGIASSADQATFTLSAADGEERDTDLKAVKPWDVKWSEGLWRAPAWYRRSDNWHTYLAGYQALYIQLYSFVGDAAQLTASIADSLNAHPVEWIVLDLRRNAGGDPGWAAPLVNSLAARPEIRDPGHLFVIVGRRTYSSTLQLCYDLREQAFPVFYGEPTAGKPGGFGVTNSAQLPYSGFTVKYPTVDYPVPADGARSFIPDVLTYQTAEDFAVGIDTVLESILRYTQLRLE